jgi:Rad3-related DNA helicase
MTAPRPTGEQQVIIDAYQSGADVVIEAGAGTGKTSTLHLVAASQPGRRGLYVAYNKAIAADAKRSFPASLLTVTI